MFTSQDLVSVTRCAHQPFAAGILYLQFSVIWKAKKLSMSLHFHSKPAQSPKYWAFLNIPFISFSRRRELHRMLSTQRTFARMTSMRASTRVRRNPSILFLQPDAASQVGYLIIP